MSDVKRTYTQVVRDVEKTLAEHGAKLASIDTHLKTINGSVQKITEEIWGKDGLRDRALSTRKDIDQLKDTQSTQGDIQEDNVDALDALEVLRSAEKAREGSWKSLGAWLLNNMIQPIVIAIVIGLIMRGM